MMHVKVIFAVSPSENGYIFSGPDNTLPWSTIKEDMDHFKKITTGEGTNAVIMGKETYLSLKGKKLPNRHMIVISSTLKDDSVSIYSSLEIALLKSDENGYKDVFIIGGRRLIEEVCTLYMVSEIYISYIHSSSVNDKYELGLFPYMNTLLSYLSNENMFYGKTISKVEKQEYNLEMKVYYNQNFLQESEESKYITLVQNVLENGKQRNDRTGMGTISVFGTYFEMDVSQSFPLLTSKRVYWKGVVEELLFFIRGDTDSKKLEEKGITIWKGNTSREFLDKRGLTQYREGELGPAYGWNWRNFGGEYIPLEERPVEEEYGKKDGKDQLQEAIRLIKEDPYSRRIMVSAWDPNKLDDICLPACHYHYQFYVDVEKQTLSILVNMRSCDVFLGLPFNIASYSLLLYVIAKVTDLKPGKVCFMLGDTHIYLDHIEQCREQLTRSLRPLPRLKVLSKKEKIEEYEMSDFLLEEYDPHPSIKAKMAI